MLLKVIWDFEGRDGISVLLLPKFNQKYEREEEEEKGGGRKCWISVMVIPNFLCPVLLPVSEVIEVKGKKKKMTNELWQCYCRNRRINFFLAIVTMVLSKMGKKKLWNIWKSKKKVVMFTIFLQYFHNKLHMISYY